MGVREGVSLFLPNQPWKSSEAAAQHRPSHISGNSREMPVHIRAPVFICPHLFLETVSFPGLAWPEGGPAEKSRSQIHLREKQVKVRLSTVRGLWELSRSWPLPRQWGFRTDSLDRRFLSGKCGAQIGHMSEVAGREPGTRLRVSRTHTHHSCKCSAALPSGVWGSRRYCRMVAQ